MITFRLMHVIIIAVTKLVWIFMTRRKISVYKSKTNRESLYLFLSLDWNQFSLKYCDQYWVLFLFSRTAYKVEVFGVILVCIFPAFSRIWTEYGEILHISPHSVRMRENAWKMWTRVTPNTDSFYAVKSGVFPVMNPKVTLKILFVSYHLMQSKRVIVVCELKLRELLTSCAKYALKLIRTW